jgi:4-aminobutyrate aminotransferase
MVEGIQLMEVNNEVLRLRRLAAVARGVNQVHPVFAARAQNDRIWDVEGKEYIDFTSGIAVLNTGHLHPEVVEAVERQMRNFTHTCFAVLPYEPYIAVCERINARVPGTGAKKTALFTTGSEAVENAVKIARAYTRRSGVIAFTGAYHGRTLLTLALTGKVAPYAAGMGLMPANVYRALYPDPLNGLDIGDAVDSIERIFRSDAAPEDIAAIIFEPVQGEGGMQVAPPEFVQRLREICDRHGIVLIADEVQSGAGRTGAFFAIEHTNITPDLVAFGKSVAGGLPLAGVAGRADVMDAVGPGGLGGTYAGNPVACAAAVAILDIMDRDRISTRAGEIGEIVRAALLDMQERYPLIADVRGLGALIGVELRHANGTPATDRAKELVAIARDRGLLLLTGGMHGNVLRILAPLTIDMEWLEAGLTILDRCLAALQ